MKAYWRYHVWEWLLCTLCAAALLLNLSQGFYIPDRLADSVPLALVVTGIFLLVCFLGGYNKKTMIGLAALLIAAAAAAFLWLRANGVDIVDEPGSGTAVYIYWFAGALVPLAVFLLSRSRAGAAVLFLLGSALNALIDFLNFEDRPWCAAMFVLAAIPLFFLRQYRKNAMCSSTVAPGFARFTAAAVGTALAALVLAGAVFFAVVRPLHPPTADLALLTRYLSYDVLERVGVARQYPIPRELLQAPPREEMPDPAESPEEQPPGPGPLPSGEAGEEPAPPERGDSAQNREELGSVSYGRKAAPYLLLAAALLAAALILLPVGRRAHRRRTLRRLRSGPPAQQVVALYRWYVKKFRVLGLVRAPAQTEREYAAAYADRLRPYTEGGADLEEMTGLYLDARYGGEVPAEACERLADFYPAFLRNCRRLDGRLRYVLHYFRL